MQKIHIKLTLLCYSKM